MVIKKIVFVIPAMQRGGAERVLSIMANNWCKNYEVSIVTFDGEESTYLLEKNINYFKLHSARKKKYILTVIFNNLIRVKNYFKVVKRIKPDVIISFTRNANVYCIIYNFFLKRNLIIGETTNPAFPILPVGMNWLTRLIYKFANGLVVQTDDTLSIFADLKISLPKKHIVIPNPVNECVFCKTQPAQRKNIILAVGRLENITKQFDKLINIFNGVENDGWELHIAGMGSDYDCLKKQICDLKLTHKIFLLGDVKNIKVLYTESKIFALTSSREGFPNALCEAMLNGCACISYNCPTGPSSIILNNVNGFLVKTNDEEKFKYKLSLLMQNENLQKQFSLEASKIIDVLDENKILIRWEKFINEVIEHPEKSLHKNLIADFG